MATINNKLIHFKSKSDFNSRYKETTDGGNTYGDFLGTSIVFIQDAKQIWTHGQFYDANETTLASLGITATAAELNYCDGVTSNIQTQLNGKQATITGGASTIVTNNLTESRALISDASGKVTVSPVTSTELGYLDGVTSSIQTQLNNKVSLVDGVLTLSGNSSTSNVINLNNSEAQDLNIISNTSNIVLKKSGGSSLSVTSDGILIGVQGNPDALRLNATGKIKRISVNDFTDLQIQSGLNWLTIPNASNGNDAKWNDGVILTEDNYEQYVKTGYKITLDDLMNEFSSNHDAIDAAVGGLANFKNAIESNTPIFGVYHYSSGVCIVPVAAWVTQAGMYTYVLEFYFLTTLHNILINTNGTDTRYQHVTKDIPSISISDTNNKLFLFGSTSQTSLNGGTNSHVYTQSGQLYATQMNATNGFYETSDARLKNFKDDIKALDVVSEIPTKYFTWKKDEVVENIDPVLHIGTSAQEIQKIYPDLVTENEEGELSVDYARLSVIALAAIKELKKEIDELKSKN